MSASIFPVHAHEWSMQQGGSIAAENLPLRVPLAWPNAVLVCVFEVANHIGACNPAASCRTCPSFSHEAEYSATLVKLVIPSRPKRPT